ncbi:hypothetical protein PHYSODRAFT_258894 [Phytophthora sojae]|uniref:ABC-2 type transporter domain-containing protein n=1 Tax=Phytophthora sojae (strain P6497) TaxID=1094619 RepID=G5A530_PHYSP|nr:hypothetical protein PHYSODRAFT_258894 [Phytophthora sojae]EGZ09779.1 hypothetical protein PHYSODRAFT_258894 [Phytophthora sojae]|eukprot:XP_009534640.1 hypothetical protein PHYSODRAFT_258894 [Phytophthora sojae]
MLEVIGAGVDHSADIDVDFARVFAASSLKAIIDENLSKEGVTVPSRDQSKLSFANKRAASNLTLAYMLRPSIRPGTSSFTLAEIPYVLVSSLLFPVVCLPLGGFTDIDDLGFYWFNLTLHVLCQIYLGQLLSFAMPSTYGVRSVYDPFEILPSMEVAGVLCNSVFVLFMGSNPPVSTILRGYKWIFDATPHRCSSMLFTALLFGSCSDDEYAQIAKMH